MNVLVILAVILFLLMILIGGRKRSALIFGSILQLQRIAHCRTDNGESKCRSHYPHANCMYGH